MPGNAICMFLSKTAWTGAFAGVFTMIVIAKERYYTVVHPHGIKGKLTTRSVKVCNFLEISRVKATAKYTTMAMGQRNELKVFSA